MANADLYLPPPLHPMWRTEDDAENEREVMARIMEAWPHVRVHQFGGRDDVDFYLEDIARQRMYAVAELKSRTHERLHYPTVYLAMRKWIDLTRVAQAFRVKALYVIRFTDCLTAIDLDNVDASRHTMGGNARGWHKNDREPLIEVPVTQLQLVGV